MSEKDEHVPVPCYVSQSIQITKIMNMKLDSRSEKRLRKMKISRSLFGLADRKSPEIPHNLPRKRIRQDPETSEEKRKSPNNHATQGTTFSRREQGSLKGLNAVVSSSDQDVFSFPSEASPRTESAESEMKHSVLKTIYRMLEENSALRQRQLMLSQVTQKS